MFKKMILSLKSVLYALLLKIICVQNFMISCVVYTFKKRNKRTQFRIDNISYVYIYCYNNIFPVLINWMSPATSPAVLPVPTTHSRARVEYL